jgi:hypothetical protein
MRGTHRFVRITQKFALHTNQERLLKANVDIALEHAANAGNGTISALPVQLRFFAVEGPHKTCKLSLQVSFGSNL